MPECKTSCCPWITTLVCALLIFNSLLLWNSLPWSRLASKLNYVESAIFGFGSKIVMLLWEFLICIACCIRTLFDFQLTSRSNWHIFALPGHPWICENGVAPDRALDPAVLSRLKQFSAMNKLKKMALRVSACACSYAFDSLSILDSSWLTSWRYSITWKIWMVALIMHLCHLSSCSFCLFPACSLGLMCSLSF